MKKLFFLILIVGLVSCAVNGKDVIVDHDLSIFYWESQLIDGHVYILAAPNPQGGWVDGRSGCAIIHSLGCPCLIKNKGEENE